MPKELSGFYGAEVGDTIWLAHRRDYRQRWQVTKGLITEVGIYVGKDLYVKVLLNRQEVLVRTVYHEVNGLARVLIFPKKAPTLIPKAGRNFVAWKRSGGPSDTFDLIYLPTLQRIRWMYSSRFNQEVFAYKNTQDQWQVSMCDASLERNSVGGFYTTGRIRTRIPTAWLPPEVIKAD